MFCVEDNYDTIYENTESSINKLTLYSAIATTKDEKTNLYLFLKNNNEQFFMTKIEKNMYLEELYIDNKDMFLNYLQEFDNLENITYMIAKNKITINAKEDTCKISKNDLIDADLTTTVIPENLFYYLNDNIQSIENNKLEGYVKFVNYDEYGDNGKVYNIYVEDQNQDLYKINLIYDTIKNTFEVCNLTTDIEKINFESIVEEGRYYLPKYVEDVSINIDNIEGLVSEITGELGSIIEFDETHVNIFENQMYITTFEKILDASIMNRSSFTEYIDEIRKENTDLIFMNEDVLKQYEQLQMDIQLHTKQEEDIIKPSKQNGIGNYEICDNCELDR